jgi:hypothetical protein
MGLRRDQRNKLVLVLKRAIEATFRADDWKEVGYATNTVDFIQGHPRLLRSLSWGDDDYGEHVFTAIEAIMDEDPKNLEVLLERKDIEGWIKENDPEVYSEYYGGTLAPTENVADAEKALKQIDVEDSIARIRDSLVKDPPLAVGSTKELLESVFKSILGLHGPSVGAEDMPKLWKRVQTALALDPGQVSASIPGSEALRHLLGSLTQIVVSVIELRNLYGTGHGKSKAPQLDIETAQLVVAAGTALASYTMRRYDQLKAGGARTF